MVKDKIQVSNDEPGNGRLDFVSSESVPNLLFELLVGTPIEEAGPLARFCRAMTNASFNAIIIMRDDIY